MRILRKNKNVKYSNCSLAPNDWANIIQIREERKYTYYDGRIYKRSN